MKRLIVSVAAVALVAGGIAGVASLRAKQPVARVQSVSSAAGAFSVDSVHSSVVFRIKHQNVAYFYGRFNTMSGSFLLNKDDASASSLSITVKAESVDTNNEDRNKHLRSQDFFSTKEHGDITFVGKEFKKTGDTTWEVKGDLTLLGQTKSVTVNVDDTGTGPGREGEVAGIETKFTIKRSDYGMSKMLGGIGDEVSLMVSLEGGRK